MIPRQNNLPIVFNGGCIIYGKHVPQREMKLISRTGVFIFNHENKKENFRS